MLSLQKLLLLVAVIGLVWYGFKMIGRFQALREREAERNEARQSRRSLPAEDMVLCGTCKTYVTPASGNGCRRADCPYEA
ncbi:MAG TPA: hypothetical protein VFO41_12010 [Alphaproteobacteria bacterium]|nr:hypothetical protein [Alphaproteobacteria bacterium]